MTYAFFWPYWTLALETFSGELLKALVVDSKVKASGDLVRWQQIGGRDECRECSKSLRHESHLAQW